MTVSLTAVTGVRLPKTVAEKTHAHLRSAGSRGLEGMALWVGVQEDTVFAIRDVVVPEQQGIRSDHGLAVMVSASELHRLSVYLYKTGMRLLAQIHSHPTNAYHSAMDDEYAIATALGAFSLVVPDFARSPFAIDHCATYRLTERPWWKRGSRPVWTKVGPAQVAAIFRIMEE